MPGTIAGKEPAYGESVSANVRVTAGAHEVRMAEIQYKDASTDEPSL